MASTLATRHANGHCASVTRRARFLPRSADHRHLSNLCVWSRLRTSHMLIFWLESCVRRPRVFGSMCKLARSILLLRLAMVVGVPSKSCCLIANASWKQKQQQKTLTLFLLPSSYLPPAAGVLPTNKKRSSSSRPDATTLNNCAVL